MHLLATDPNRIDDPNQGVTSDTGALLVIPQWIAESDISDRAFRLYAIISRYVRSRVYSVPGRKELARLLGCSVSTLSLALKELVDVGAINTGDC